MLKSGVIDDHQYLNFLQDNRVHPLIHDQEFVGENETG